MKKFLLGVLAVSFLTCIGIETFHHHNTQEPQNCVLCVVKTQAQSKLAPNAAPDIVRVLTQDNFFTKTTVVIHTIVVSDPTARAPPFA